MVRKGTSIRSIDQAASAFELCTPNPWRCDRGVIATLCTIDINSSLHTKTSNHSTAYLQVQTDPEASRKNVLELLHILGMSQKADMRVSELSGGEKKRLSIGLGMVSGEYCWECLYVRTTLVQNTTWKSV